MNPTKPVARTKHACSFCGRAINPGTRYHYEKITPWESVQGGGDAIFWTYRAHLACDDAWRLWDYSDMPWEGDSWEFRTEVLHEPELMAARSDPLVYRARNHYEIVRAALLGDQPRSRHRRRQLADAG